MVEQKSVLITGCSAGGIGHALAKEYHARGLRVFATARRLEAMAELEKLGIEILQLDVTKEDSIVAVRDEVAKRTDGKLDILVNNAGIAYTMPATDISLAKVREMFETNIFGIMTMVQAFANLLIATKGRIVNISSISSLEGVAPFCSAYAASKGALNSYGDTLRLEMQPFGVKVITVIAGGVLTHVTETPRNLPSTSLFYPMKTEYETQGISRSQDATAITAEDFARGVVRQTLSSSAPVWIWRGGRAWTVWFVSTFMWRGSMDWLVARTYGFPVFAKGLKDAPKTKPTEQVTEGNLVDVSSSN
jgi:1-acylglycerone phosphate reductase